MKTVEIPALKESKCVILVNGSLPAGLAANTAAMLAFSAGALLPDAVGKELMDSRQIKHVGLLQIPLPILKASCRQLQDVMERKEQLESDCLLLDFSTLAQSCRTYEEFEERLAKTDSRTLDYSGVLLFGPKKTIDSLCGALPLYRGAADADRRADS